jgi:AcrR family transcriptional regulator
LQTGLQEIGAAIGLAPYAVRARFGNREMVLEAVLDRHMDRLLDRLGAYRAHAEGHDPGERLLGAIRDLLDLLFAYRAGQRVHVAAVAGASPHLARSLTLRQRHLVHFYAGLIARAVPEAEGRTELAMPAALSLMGMACWHVLWFREQGALSRAEYARLLAHMVTDGVRAAASADVGGLE